MTAIAKNILPERQPLPGNASLRPSRRTVLKGAFGTTLSAVLMRPCQASELPIRLSFDVGAAQSKGN